jgi:cytochrome c peroxidase
MMVLVRGAIAIFGCAAGVALSACTDELLVDKTFTEAEWRKIEGFSPLPTPPPSPTNRYADSDLAAAFGQMMFFERRLSGATTSTDPSADSAYACVSCHDPERWFIDTRSVPDKVSVGAGHTTKRNSPSMVNIAYYEWGGWAGAQDQFWKQGANAPEGKDLNGNRLSIAHLIYQHYFDEYNAAFDPDLIRDDEARLPPAGKPGDSEWDTLPMGDQLIVDTIMANIGKAFEAYERRLISGNAPFDRYVAGDFSALTPSAKRGLKLFISKAGCASCHKDQTFTDQQFHNTAVYQGPMIIDQGRFEDVPRFIDNPFNGAGIFSDDKTAGEQKLEGIAQTDDLKGQFRTKSLRQIGETGPYFHDGSVANLRDVVVHYNKGGATEGYPGTKDGLMEPLNLTETEIDDIVAFLFSLTGDEVDPALRVDTAKR